MINKKMKIIFYDGDNHYSQKEGIVTSVDDFCIVLDDKCVIPKKRIIRGDIILG